MMKFYFTLFLCFSAIISSAQTTAIPDSNFEQQLITLGIDSDGVINGQVFTKDIEQVTSLTLHIPVIVDLNGIKGFTALTFLLLEDGQMTELDLSQNTLLTSLGIGV